jgi:uncharacterized protein YkwD
MRHGIVAAGCLVLALSMTSWVVAPPSVGIAARPVETEAAVRPLRTPPPEAELSVSDAPSTAVRLVPDHLVIEKRAAPESPAPIRSSAASGVKENDGARFLSAINALRSERGLAPLSRHVVLDEMAQMWAEVMAADESLRHSELIHEVVAGVWTRAGENVGYGPTAVAIFEGLEASPGHLDNMLNPEYERVGLGTVRVDGVLWTAHLFAG